jgi:hypothetical protein
MVTIISKVITIDVQYNVYSTKPTASCTQHLFIVGRLVGWGRRVFVELCNMPFASM